MTSSDQLPLLEFDIDKTRRRLALDRTLLTDQLAPFGGNADVVDALLSAVDEWGADHVGGLLAATPARYNLSVLPAAKLANVSQLLAQLGEAGSDIDYLVSAREAILAETDPTRQRVYAWFDQEFALNEGGKRMHFVAPDAAPVAATLRAVPNRASPTVAPDADPSVQRRRRRDRDR